MMDVSPVVLIIMIVTGLFTYQGLKDFNFFYKYCFDVSRIKSGEIYRIVSSGFLHVDWMHFMFNMLTLYFFGDLVLYAVGPIYFLLIYFVSMIVGNMITYQFYQNVPNYRAVGASGAIMGILYASIMMNPDMMLGVFFIIPMPSYVFAILYLLYSVYGMRKQSDGIGHSAHIGGAIGGLVLILLKFPILISSHSWLIAIMLIPILILFVLYKKGKL